MKLMFSIGFISGAMSGFLLLIHVPCYLFLVTVVDLCGLAEIY